MSKEVKNNVFQIVSKVQDIILMVMPVVVDTLLLAVNIV